MGNAVGCDERKMERAGEIDGGLVAGFFGAIVMALEFDVHVFRAEDSGQAFDVAGVEGERAFVAAGQADEAFGEFGEIVCCRGGLAGLWTGAQFHAGHEAAEILVALARFDKQGVAAAFCRGYFRSDVGLDAELLRGGVEAGRSVDAVDVG